MHAVLGHVTLDSAQQAVTENILKEVFVPTVKEAPGFVRGIWTRSDDGTVGRSMVLYETREAAEAALAAFQAQPPPPDAPIEFHPFEIVEVVVEA